MTSKKTSGSLINIYASDFCIISTKTYLLISIYALLSTITAKSFAHINLKIVSIISIFKFLKSNLHVTSLMLPSS